MKKDQDLPNWVKSVDALVIVSTAPKDDVRWLAGQHQRLQANTSESSFYVLSQSLTMLITEWTRGLPQTQSCVDGLPTHIPKPELVKFMLMSGYLPGKAKQKTMFAITTPDAAL